MSGETNRSFSVGDLVWANTGCFLSREEPATIVKIGCDYNYIPADDEPEEEDGKEVDKEEGGEDKEQQKEEDSSPYFRKKKRNDGIMLKLQVSQCRRVLPPTSIRPYNTEGEDDREEEERYPKRRRGAGRRLRSRSPPPGTTKSSTTADSNNEATELDTAGSSSGTINDNRQVVTPSPPPSRLEQRKKGEENYNNDDNNNDTTTTTTTTTISEQKRSFLLQNVNKSCWFRDGNKGDPYMAQVLEYPPRKATTTTGEDDDDADYGRVKIRWETNGKTAEVQLDDLLMDTEVEFGRGKRRSQINRTTTTTATTGQDSSSGSVTVKAEEVEGEKIAESNNSSKEGNTSAAPGKTTKKTTTTAKRKRASAKDDNDSASTKTKKKPTKTNKKSSSVAVVVTPTPSLPDTNTKTGRKKTAATTAATKGKPKKKAPAAAGAAAATKGKTKKNASAAATKEKPKNKDDDDKETTKDNDSDNSCSDEDEDDEKPYQVGYSPSSRATCKTCDTVIQKGDVRISHRPLFNGKPGFNVFRHLRCQVFSEQIHDRKQIGGYSKLKKEDRVALSERIEQSKIELEQENQELEPDELVQQTFGNKKQLVKRKTKKDDGQEVETEEEVDEVLLDPSSDIPGLDATLLPFQVEGVSWMVHQETKIPELRGGILADEMGMGKTLQTISTILANRPLIQHCPVGMKHDPSADDLQQRRKEETSWNKAFDDWLHEMKMNKVDVDFIDSNSSNEKSNIRRKLSTTKKKKKSSGDDDIKKKNRRAGTLVVCPVIALIQWKLEIEKFVKAHNDQNGGCVLTIATYHGPNRAKEYPCIELLQKYDIVLTTYQVLESDFRKMVSPNKITCPNCGNKFKLDKLRIHLKYFCGETAQRTEAQSRQRRTADRDNNNNPRRPPPGRPFIRGGKDDKKKKKKTFESTKKKKLITPAEEEDDDDEEDSETEEDSEATKPVMTKSSVTKTKGGKKTAKAVVKKEQKTGGKQGSGKKEGNKASTKKQGAKPMVVTSSSATTPPPTTRPSRSAAVSASKRLSDSVKEWGGGNKNDTDDDAVVDSGDDDDDDDDESIGSVEEEDSEGEALINLKRKTSKTRGKTISKPIKTEPVESSSEDDEDDEEDEALVRARKRQKLAMEQAKKQSKVAKKGTKKSFEKDSVKKGRGKKTEEKKKTPTKKKMTKKGKAGKKMPSKKKKRTSGKKRPYRDESGSSSSSSYGSSDDDDDSSDDDDNNTRWYFRDPLDGIDLDELMREAMAGAKMSILHSLCWWRVVLDEAHFIKSRSSQTSAAAFALTSIHRWCLSGTPLQNRVGELYSLIRFLRIDPMAHYFCRKSGCNCKSIHYRMEHGKCLDCGCAAFMHYSHFNKHVLNPIQREGYTGDGRRAMFKLKNEVLDHCLMRRTKESRAEDMNLPPRIVTIRPIRLHPIEEDFYNALYTQTRSSFDDYIAEGTLLNNYAHIFDLLTKMRQAVDHPYLIVYSKKNCAAASLSNNNNNTNAQQQRVANGSVDCDLCHEPPTDRLVSSCCGAAFCRGCVTEYMTVSVNDNNNNDNGTPCPSCGAPFSIDFNQTNSDIVDDSTLAIPTGGSGGGGGTSSGGTHSASSAMPSLKEIAHVNSGSILRRINLAEFATSTKIEVLVQELISMRKKRPGSKALVFSQFVNMLDLIRWRIHSDPCLGSMGLGVRVLHGGMDVKARDATLKDFREENNVRILLMSLKAGGVALNLTVASEVYLMDNWWNPAAEMQAIDRTHRLGQYRPIRAVRFIAEGTVEERVLQLQEKKRLVFDGTVGRDAGSLKMLNVDDMKALFA